MGKRFIFLIFFSFLICVGKSQVLSVDSVEVSIVIPAHDEKEFVPQQDTITEEVGFDPLSYFFEIDSMLPDERIFSSQKIEITIPDHYSPLARPVMYYNAALKMLLFGREDSLSFNPYSLTIHWPQPQKYKPFALSLKYKPRDYEDVTEFQSGYERTALDQYQYFLQHPLGADTLLSSYDERAVTKMMEELVIDKPSMTEELWERIPDPPKYDFGGGYIDTKASRDKISQLFWGDSPDTNRELKKKEEIKKPWSFGGTENIQFSQAFQENWVRGGENSVSLLSDLRIQARYKKENIEWESYAIHKLGILNTEEKKSRVNDDLIELNSKYGLSAGQNWYYSGLFNFKTQFFYGYQSSDELKENPISGFLAPGYMTMAVGMDYKEENFTLMLLPITSRMTIVADTVQFDQTSYKIPEDKKIDNMGGASLVNNLEWEISDDFNFSSKLDFFYEYMRSDSQMQAEWEMILDMKINIFLSARIGTYLRYYTNESEYVQFRENLSVSFNYRF